jgi:hypothetical protein
MRFLKVAAALCCAAALVWAIFIKAQESSAASEKEITQVDGHPDQAPAVRVLLESESQEVTRSELSLTTPPPEHFLRFVDAQKNAVSGVRLCYSQTETFGPSKGDGTIGYSRHGSPIRCWARTPGFADHPVLIGESEPLFREVVLTAEASISGNVLLPGGLPAIGARLLAWDPTTIEGTSLATSDAIAGELGIKSCESDERGAFLFSGLTPGRSYMLASGMPGMASSASQSALRCPSGDVTIQLHYLYGAILCLGGEDGRIFNLDPRCKSGWLPDISYRTDEETKRGVVGPQALLAGLGADDMRLVSGPWCVLFETLQKVENLYVECIIDRPNLGSTSTRVPFRLVGSSLPIHKFDSGYLGSKSGSLVVIFASSAHPEGELRLRSLQGGRAASGVFHIPAEPSSTLPFELPFGSYGCRFATLEGSIEYPPQNQADVEIEISDASAVFNVPPIAVGVLEIEIQIETPWFKRIQCLIGDPPLQGRGNELNITNGDIRWASGPPFRLAGITAGTHSLYVVSPKTTQRVPDLVDIQPNVTSRLTVVIK